MCVCGSFLISKITRIFLVKENTCTIFENFDAFSLLSSQTLYALLRDVVVGDKILHLKWGEKLVIEKMFAFLIFLRFRQTQKNETTLTHVFLMWHRSRESRSRSRKIGIEQSSRKPK